MPNQAQVEANVLVPGPRGSTILKNILLNRDGDGVQRMVQLQQTYGDLVHLQIANRHIYILYHPDDVQQVLQMNNRNYIKGELLDKLRVVAGNGLFTSEGDFWRRQRRMMQPFFHRTVIATFGEIMVAEIHKMLALWDRYAADQVPFELQEAMMRLTLSVVAKALLTTALSDEQLNTVHETLGPVLVEIASRSRRPFDLVEKLPTPANRAFTSNLARLNEIIYSIIDQRRRDGAAYQDLLQMLIDAEDEETGERMSGEQLRDEVITLFVAGHETTATALTWAFKLLSEQPAVRRSLHAEVDTVLQGRTPTAADFPNLPFTLATFEETLRLYPPVVNIVRTLLEADTLRGHLLPADTNVVINTYALHRHPGFWENPEGFDPERFLPEGRKDRHRFAYIPFSSGPRFCIGESFAKLEAVLILAMVAQHFEVNLVPGQTIAMRSLGTLRPTPGVTVLLKHR
jgi:cytochrome P450